MKKNKKIIPILIAALMVVTNIIIPVNDDAFAEVKGKDLQFDAVFQDKIGKIEQVRTLLQQAEEAFKSDKTKSFELYMQVAKLGDMDGQFRVGRQYHLGDADGNFGDVVGIDREEAAKWYHKSAEQGHARAQNNLGLLYECGEGVEKDYGEAAKWYRKSAEQGLALAQYHLGEMLREGNGVDEDEEEAVEWYRKAAVQGLAESQCQLGLMYEEGDGVGKDEEEAVKWYRKAADQGLARAQYFLGWNYHEGIGVEEDDEKSKYWLKKAARQGYEDAKEKLDEWF